MNKIKLTSFIAPVLLGLGLLTSLPGSADDHMVPLIQTCSTCHGDNGVSNNAEWPNLAGQSIGYLTDQINAFRSGARENALMSPMVKNLSDEQVSQLASFYNQQALGIAANGDASLVTKGNHEAAYCVSCHGMEGVPANPEWPVLAGQQADYLFTQLKAFRDGSRDNTIMNNIVKGYEDSRLKALAAYFSQLKPAQPAQ